MEVESKSSVLHDLRIMGSGVSNAESPPRPRVHHAMPGEGADLDLNDVIGRQGRIFHKKGDEGHFERIDEREQDNTEDDGKHEREGESEDVREDEREDERDDEKEL